MEQSKNSQGITSVKVHHQPGGNQTHNIFGDSSVDDDRFGNRKNTKSAAPVATPEEEKKEEVASATSATPQVSQTAG